VLTSRHRLGYCARIINTTKQNIFWTFIPIVPKCPGRKAFFVYLLFIADEPDDVFFTGQNHLIVQVGAGIKRGA
jgi:hypothetical protein